MMFPLDLPWMFAIFGSMKEAISRPPPPKTTASSLPCPGCARTFSNKGARARHLQAEPLHDVRPTAARPHQCETCKRTFPDQASLAKHVVRFHPAWPRPNQAAIEDKSVPASTPALQATVEEVDDPADGDNSDESVSEVKPEPKPHSSGSNKRKKKRKARRQNLSNAGEPVRITVEQLKCPADEEQKMNTCAAHCVKFVGTRARAAGIEPLPAFDQFNPHGRVYGCTGVRVYGCTGVRV
jgi:hypothetical protein